MRNVIRSAVCVLAIALTGSLLSGCNTAEGVGKDIKSAGKALEEAAK